MFRFALSISINRIPPDYEYSEKKNYDRDDIDTQEFYEDWILKNRKLCGISEIKKKNIKWKANFYLTDCSACQLWKTSYEGTVC